MATYTQGVPMHEYSGMTVQDLYNPETQAYEWKPTPAQLAKYQDWQGNQQSTYDSYLSRVDAINNFRDAQYGAYGNYDLIEKVGGPDLSWTAFKQDSNWFDNVDNLYQMPHFNYFSDNKAGHRAADGSLHNLAVYNADSGYLRDWKQANPELSRQMFWDRAGRTQPSGANTSGLGDRIRSNVQGMLSNMQEPRVPDADRAELLKRLQQRAAPLNNWRNIASNPEIDSHRQALRQRIDNMIKPNGMLGGSGLANIFARFRGN